MMAALLDSVADAGARLAIAARSVGGTINFDPRAALHRDTAAPLAVPGRESANGHCRMIETQGGWLAVNLPREDDRLSVPAWTGSDVRGSPWQTITDAARDRSAADLLEQAALLHLPVAHVGETVLRYPIRLRSVARSRRQGPTAVDLSALWAGPFCAGLLADAGIDVTRIESTTRPDPTVRTSPKLDRRINGNKRRVAMAIDDPALFTLIADTDILITSGRPHALERIGLSPARLLAANPDLIWVAVTAHGWHGQDGIRVGFGDDCAAAGGLIAWYEGCPHFIGDALADPLTGLLAAISALEALGKEKAGLIDASLAQSAAHFAQRIAAA